MTHLVPVNDAAVFAAKSGYSCAVNFHDNMTVVAAVNKTTGDYLVLNYCQADGTQPPSVHTRALYKTFFNVPGEKTAFILGCNAGQLSAGRGVKEFSKLLFSPDTDVATIDPALLSLPAGYGTNYRFSIDPATGSASLESGGNAKITKQTIPLFADIVPTASSRGDDIKAVAAFFQQVATAPQSLTLATFKDHEEIKGRAAFLSYRLQVHQEALPKTEAGAKLLADAFALPTAGEADIMRVKDAFSYPEAMTRFVAKLDMIYDAVAQLQALPDKGPPANKTAIDGLKNQLKACYIRVGEIARQQQFTDVAAQVEGKLGAIRNMGTKQLG